VSVAANGGLRVGLSIALPRSKRDVSLIWSNGALQNTLFLYLLLRQSTRLREVILLNTADARTEDIPEGLTQATGPLNVVPLREGLGRIDVLIEAGTKLGFEVVHSVRARGGKAIAYKVGNDYVIDVESAVFNTRPGASLFNGAQFDQVWSIPQHMRTCASYWEVAHRCPVIEVPHLWSPVFFRQGAAGLAAQPAYRPGRARKRIAIFEPNLDVVKSSHYPLLVCEAAFRRDPEALEHVYVLNTAHLKEHAGFKQFALNLDIVKAGKASFEPRHPTPRFLAQYTDVVVTHQWENELNYLYYEALYGGYPLVHNSAMLGGCGYYYKPFDAGDGASTLLATIRDHDRRLEDYNAKSQELLRQVDIANPDTLARHEAMLLALAESRGRA
jgi:hypothetical protein